MEYPTEITWNEKHYTAPKGYYFLKVDDVIINGDGYFNGKKVILYIVHHNGLIVKSHFTHPSVRLIPKVAPAPAKLKNIKYMNDKDILIPDGYSLVKVGQKIPKGSLYLPHSNDIKGFGSKDITQWRKDTITIGHIRQSHWLLSIKKTRKVGPAIPKGYRIIKSGEIIPEEHYIIMGLKGNNDINNWKKSTISSGYIRGNSKDSIYIAEIVPPAPKKYNLELSRDQVKILSILLNNNAKTLNNLFTESSNYYIEKSPELIEAADDEFRKAGCNVNSIWNKLDKIREENKIDFGDK